MMGKITVFSVDTCHHCQRVKELLVLNGATFTEISLTSKPEWRHYLFLLSNGMLDPILGVGWGGGGGLGTSE